MLTRRLVLTALVLGLAGAVNADAATVRSCGSLPGEGVVPTRIRATGESCAEAKRVANVVGKVAQAPFNGCVSLHSARIRLIKPCVRRTYSCRTIKRIGFEGNGIRISCARGSRTVKFDLR